MVREDGRAKPGRSQGNRSLHTSRRRADQFLELRQADAVAVGAEVFARGLYFRYEDLTTLPAQLEILAPRAARLTLHEGRYHQVKRMFGHFQNKVTRLHRERMGGLALDPQLAPGQYRALSAAELAALG